MRSHSTKASVDLEVQEETTHINISVASRITVVKQRIIDKGDMIQIYIVSKVRCQWASHYKNWFPWFYDRH